MDVNATLLHVLQTDFGIEFDRGDLASRVPDGAIDDRNELGAAFDWLREQVGGRAPGFQVDPRLVLTNFAYMKLPMVRDIENSLEQLAAHDMIAAIAGDETARAAVRSRAAQAPALPDPDHTPLADEFLVLDADASQNAVINRVLAGESLTIKGPPGTGKSQTIANLITTLIAHGRTVLFVAEKRAAIDAVNKRIKERGLGELVLDVHGGVSSRSAFASSIGQSLEAGRDSHRPDAPNDRQELERRRAELNAYVDSLHGLREPWDISLSQLRAELLDLPAVSGELRLAAERVDALDGRRAREIEAELTELASLGSFRLTKSPWARSPITDPGEVTRAAKLLERFRTESLPQTWRQLAEATAALGLNAPSTVSGWRQLIEIWDGIERTLQVCTADVYDLDFAAITEALESAPHGGLAPLRSRIGSSSYRHARSLAHDAVRSGHELDDRALGDLVRSAGVQARAWNAAAGRGRPKVPHDLEQIHDLFEPFLAQLNELSALAGHAHLDELPGNELTRSLAALAADRRTLVNLPTINQTLASLDRSGLHALVDELRRVGADERQAVRNLPKRLAAVGMGTGLARRPDSDRVRCHPSRIGRQRIPRG